MELQVTDFVRVDKEGGNSIKPMTDVKFNTLLPTVKIRSCSPTKNKIRVIALPTRSISNGDERGNKI
jgi:hypothetical protein